jgi:YesN/AraC family two-component response regulator
VLYIDDEESNLRVFKNTFRREFCIYLASSASEGMEVLNNEKIDVIITDQRMPGKTGVELLKEIHENSRYPSSPANGIGICRSQRY